MTIQAFETRLHEILLAELPPNVVTDELGNTTPRDEYRAGQLSLLSQEIRRIAWAPEAKAEALRIARKADEKAADLVGGAVRPLPRFESFISGGAIVPAIQ